MESACCPQKERLVASVAGKNVLAQDMLFLMALNGAVLVYFQGLVLLLCFLLFVCVF